MERSGRHLLAGGPYGFSSWGHLKGRMSAMPAVAVMELRTP